MSAWADFQSLFQLSVGLNTAFAALYDFFGNTAQRKAEEAQRWALRTRQLEADWIQMRGGTIVPPEVPALQSEFVLLEGGFVDAHAKNENIVLNYVRWLCLLAAMSSLCFLVISSFFATGRIVLGFQICAVVAYAPFAWGLVMVMALSIHVRLGANQMAKHQARLIEEETKYYRMEKQSTETKSGGTSDGH